MQNGKHILRYGERFARGELAEQDGFVFAVVVTAAADGKMKLVGFLQEESNFVLGVTGIITFHAFDPVSNETFGKGKKLRFREMFFAFAAERMCPDGDGACG
jgi:hypothetical protein